MTAQEDRVLVIAWRGGDNGAGHTLIERHRPAVLRLFRNKVGSTSEAEELAKRTFAGAVKGVVRLRDDAAVRTWILAVARHVLLQWLEETARGRRFAGRLDDASVADLGLGPTPAPSPGSDAKRLLEALRRVPLASQLVLELVYWEELSPRDVADVLGCLEIAVRSHLREGKAALREGLPGVTPQQLDAWAQAVRAAWGR